MNTFRNIVSISLVLGVGITVGACDFTASGSNQHGDVTEPDGQIDIPSDTSSIKQPDTSGVDQPENPPGWIAFTVVYAGFDFQIHLAEFSDPLTTTVISPQGAFHEPRFSPSGRWISFSSYSLNPSKIYDTQSGGEAIEISPIMRGYRVAWAGDDSHFYFDDIGGSGDEGRVIKYDIASRLITYVTSDYRVLSEFRGDSLLVRNSADQIFSYHPVTGERRRLTNSFFDTVSGYLDELDWDRESGLIALSGRDWGTARYYIALVSPDGSIVQKVTSGVHYDWRPRFGPMGYLLFDRFNDPSDISFKTAERIMILEISTGLTKEFLEPQAFDNAIGIGSIDFHTLSEVLQ